MNPARPHRRADRAVGLPVPIQIIQSRYQSNPGTAVLLPIQSWDNKYAALL
jgi:hypothetical protein